MNVVNIHTNLEDGAWHREGYIPSEDKIVHVKEGVRVGRMPRGMASGKSSVIIFAPLPDGRMIAVEMSAANFECCAAAMRGADQRDEDARNRRNQ